MKKEKVDMIRVELMHTAVTKDKIKELKKGKVKAIDLVAVSSNNYILSHSKKGYTFEDIKKAAKLIRSNRLELGLNIEVGLPDSTRIDELNTAKDFIKLKPKQIVISPTIITKGTIYEELYKERIYEPITLEQAIERCKELYYFFEEKHVEVIKIKNEENIEKELVAGPYNEAFEQLVESRIWYDSIVNKIKQVNVKVKEVEIELNPRDVKHVVGHKGENITKLKELYEVDVKIVENEKKMPGKFDIKILKTFSDFYEEK